MATGDIYRALHARSLKDPEGILGRAGGGDRLEQALGHRARFVQPAILSLVRGRRAQCLPQRARPPRRRRPRRPAGADLRLAGHRHQDELHLPRAARPRGGASPACSRPQGVGKGDRVIIYMPMIPEAVMAMLACARLGAVHSVVFGGFARQGAGEPHRRLQAEARADGLVRHRARPHRRTTSRCSTARSRWRRTSAAACILLQRPQGEATMVAGRDLDWVEAMEAATPHGCVPVRRPIRSTSSTPRARPASPRAWCATTAATAWRSNGR